LNAQYLLCILLANGLLFQRPTEVELIARVFRRSHSPVAHSKSEDIHPYAESTEEHRFSEQMMLFYRVFRGVTLRKACGQKKETYIEVMRKQPSTARLSSILRDGGL
jgi:hypothetical protein